MYALLRLCELLCLVVLKVGDGPREYIRAIAKHAKSGVAGRTENAAHSASCVVVVKRQCPPAACSRYATDPLANGTHAALRFKHAVVFSRFYAEFLSAMAIRCKPRGLFAVGFPPSFLLVFAARTTEALKAIHLFLAGSEFSHRLHGLACAAPLHTKRGFGPARGQAVMPMQVSERLTFHPATVLAVPCRRQCGPTTSALANAFRSFHVHISCR